MEAQKSNKILRRKGGDYDDFIYSKEDKSIYFFGSPVIKGYSLTAVVVKDIGEKVTDEDITNGFVVAMVEELTSFEYAPSKHLFETLPLEFYTPETYKEICTQVSDYMVEHPYEKEPVEERFKLFKEYAYSVNPEEIPQPHHSEKNREK